MSATTPRRQCPHCGAVDHYRKARAIWESGTFALSGRTDSAGLSVGTRGHIAASGSTGSLAAVQQSTVAARLAPPPDQPPPGPMPRGCAIVMAIPATWLIGMLAEAIYQSSVAAWLIWAGGAALILMSLLWDKAQPDEVRLRAYHDLRESYERLWYCQRCGRTSSEEVPGVAPIDPLDAELRLLVACGNRIGAVAKCQQATGMDARRALEYIERFLAKPPSS